MSLQEEKEKVQAQKEEVLSHVNDVLENELQCIICSEYFIELSMHGGWPPPHTVHQPSRLLLLQGVTLEGILFRNLELFDLKVTSEGGHSSLHHAVFTVLFLFLDVYLAQLKYWDKADH